MARPDGHLVQTAVIVAVVSVSALQGFRRTAPAEVTRQTMRCSPAQYPLWGEYLPQDTHDPARSRLATVQDHDGAAACPSITRGTPPEAGFAPSRFPLLVHVQRGRLSPRLGGCRRTRGARSSARSRPPRCWFTIVSLPRGDMHQSAVSFLACPRRDTLRSKV